MRVSLVAISTLLLLACDPASDHASAKPRAPTPTKPKPTTKKPAMHPISIDWKLERAGSSLRVRYTIQNTSDKPVVLLDRLYHPTSKGNEPAFDRVIVRNSDTPGVVSFVLGYVKPDQPIGGVHQPLSRKLEPKETFTAEAIVPLPLEAWHNFARPKALDGTLTDAVLEVGYLVDHQKWVKLRLSDGTEPSGPGHPFVDAQKFARSDTKRIP